MARLRRLAVAGQTHCIVQRGHSGQAVFADAEDRAAYLSALYAVARAENVALHAWALMPTEVLLLATPVEGAALGRMVQALGRRYVSAYNRRHRRSGTLWDGRFRCAVVEPGGMRLAALRWVDGQSPDPGTTTAAQRTGGVQDAAVADIAEFWALGNTPFERQSAYAALLAEGLPPAIGQQLQTAALGGWVVGSPTFAERIAQAADRPVRPRPRGRPGRARRGTETALR